MFDFRKVIEGWRNFAYRNPTIEEMATERAETCAVCPHSNPDYIFKGLTKNDTIEEIRGLVCKLCGCPLSSKLRVPFEKCPDLRWSTYHTKPNKMNTTNIHIVKESHQKQLGDIAQAAATIAYKPIAEKVITAAHKALQEIVAQRNMILVELQGIEHENAKFQAELTKPVLIIDKDPGGEDLFEAEGSILEIAEAILKSMKTIDASQIVNPIDSKKLSNPKLYTDREEKITGYLNAIRDVVIIKDTQPVTEKVDDSAAIAAAAKEEADRLAEIEVVKAEAEAERLDAEEELKKSIQSESVDNQGV